MPAQFIELGASAAPPTVADLFCGAGGLSLGFRRAGFNPVFALDVDRWATATYAENIGDHVLQAPIGSVFARKNADGTVTWRSAGSEITTPRIDILVGGPPCQGFSPLNRSANAADPRNKLWTQYYRILKAVRPRVFVIENVPQLLASDEFRRLRRRARSRGYHLAFGVLNAEVFGVPQRRRRAIIIGSLDEPISLPTSYRAGKTVRQAFRGLPLKPNNENLHNCRKPTILSRMRYAAVPIGGNRFDLPDKLLPPCWRKKVAGSADVFGRMRYDEPSPTIRTEFVKPEKGRYLHPTENRPITLREGARLQTFPDTFQFMGSNTQIARQIGNAVPVTLAYLIARHIMRSYSGFSVGNAAMSSQSVENPRRLQFQNPT